MLWFDWRRTWRVGTGLLVFGLAACGGGGDGGTGPNGDVGHIAGDYALVSVDGATAPVTIDFDNCEDVRFRAGGVSLGEDGTWQLAVQLFGSEAPLVHVYYDWCGEGHADVDLTFTN